MHFQNCKCGIFPGVCVPFSKNFDRKSDGVAYYIQDKFDPQSVSQNYSPANGMYLDKRKIKKSQRNSGIAQLNKRMTTIIT